MQSDKINSADSKMLSIHVKLKIQSPEMSVPPAVLHANFLFITEVGTNTHLLNSF